MRSVPENYWRRLAADLMGDHVLGEATEGGQVRMSPTRRYRGTYIIGQPGTGKTTLIENMVLQDIRADHGLALITPERDTIVDHILPLIPRERWDDVVYINPAESPVPFNPLHLGRSEDLDLKADETMTILQRLFGDQTGTSTPRMDTILRHCIHTLMQIPDSTLLDIERLLDREDHSFRTWALSRIPDERDRAFWASTYPRYPKDAHHAVTNRLDRFLQPLAIRRLLCAKGQSFDLRRAMDSGKILLFVISDGALGRLNAELVGQLIVAKFQLATMSRFDTPEEYRRPFYVYIDEFQTFCNQAVASYDTMLSRARKYRAPLILAHQQIGQIADGLMRGIFGTVSTIISFAVGDADARRLAREMGIGPESLRYLPIGQCYCRVGGKLYSMKTEPPAQAGDPGASEQIVRQSRERFGAPHTGGQSGPESTAKQEKSDSPNLDDLDPGQVFS